MPKGVVMAAALRKKPAELYHLWAHFPATAASHLMLVDLGASVSALPHYVYLSIPLAKRPKLEPTDEPISAGNGMIIKCFGIVALEVTVSDITWKQTFRICDNNTQGLFGKDFLDFHKVTIQCGNNGHMFMRGKELELSDQNGKRFFGRATLPRTYYIPAGQRTTVQARLTRRRGDLEGETVLIEPCKRFRRQTGLIAGKVAAKVRNGCVPIELYNPGTETVTAPVGTTTGLVVPVTAIHAWDAFEGIAPRNMSKASINCIRSIPLEEMTPPEVPSHLVGMYEKNAPGLNDLEDMQFRQLLVEYQDVFAKDGYDLGKCNLVQHHIDTGDERPVKRHTRRTPQSQFEEVKKQICELSKSGRISPSNSPWGANVLLVRKKDGSWRMCIDYRELNMKTKNVDPYLLPRIDDTIDSLGTAKFFCTLDLIQGYHQVELTPESRPKTAFVVPRMIPSQWEFNYMPFGVQGGPSTFQRLMDQLLKGLEHRIALAYLDDIIVFGESPMECIGHLRVVFDRIREANLKLKPKKCEFFKTELLYLGHIVSGTGIKCDPAKIEAVKNWAVPRSIRATRSFLGTVNYYHRFIENFAHHAQALFAVCGKRKKFIWDDECQVAFETLRQKLIEAPVMAYPLDDGRYILDTDASGFAIGGVLSQEQPDAEGVLQEKVISYGSRTLQACERRYCTRRRELLAVVHFVKQFKPYLYGRECLIRTDHASLRFIKKLKDPNEQFSRWIETLEETLYTIEIRSGKLHANADGLSRLEVCGGRRCICEGVNIMEDEGEIHDNYKFESAVYADEAAEAAGRHPRRHTDHCNKRNQPDGAREMSAEEVQSNSRQPEETSENNAQTGDQREILNDDVTSIGDEVRDPPAIIACIRVRRNKYNLRRQKGRMSAKNQNHLYDDQVEKHVMNFDKLWTAEEMAEEQSIDPDMALLYKCKRDHLPRPLWEEVSPGSAALCTFWLDWERLSLVNHVMYRRFESKDGTEFSMQLLLPFRYQDVLARHFHDVPSAAHMGRRRTFNQVHKRAYWFHMADDLKLWIQTCDLCQRRKRPGITPRAPKKIYHAGTPNHRVSMDICGPLVKTTNGNKVIMVITDDFTKFTRAFALPNHTAVTISDAFQDGWVSIFGAPREVHSDRGPEFESNTFRQLCSVFKCMKTRTTAYHPSSDGQVERFNQTMAQMLNALTGEDRLDWDEQLKYVCQAYNATKHTTTGVEPNRLWFAYPVSMPFDVMIPAPPTEEEVGQREYVRKTQRRMRRIYQLARQRIGNSATYMKRLGDRAATKHRYQVGDIVLLKNFRLQPGIKKLQDRYIGPYYVLDRLGDQTLRVTRGPADKPDVVHYDRLKPYYARNAEETDLEWVFQRSWDRFQCAPVQEKESQTLPTESFPDPLAEPPEIEEGPRDPREREYWLRSTLTGSGRGIEDEKAKKEGQCGGNEWTLTEVLQRVSARKTVTVSRPAPREVFIVQKKAVGTKRKVIVNCVLSSTMSVQSESSKTTVYNASESYVSHVKSRMNSYSQTEDDGFVYYEAES